MGQRYRVLKEFVDEAGNTHKEDTTGMIDDEALLKQWIDEGTVELADEANAALDDPDNVSGESEEDEDEDEDEDEEEDKK